MFRRITVISVSVSSFLLFVFSGILVSIVLLNRKFERTDESTEDYKYLSWNHRTNETSRGIVTLPELLGSNFISSNSDDNLVLISRFEFDEFKCTGTCSCVLFSERRSVPHTTTLLKGLIVLVAAVSTLMATRLAKDNFLTDCTDRYGETCASDHVLAEVDQCERISKEESSCILDGSNADFETNKKRRYWCRGKCMTKKMRTKKMQVLADTFDCDALECESIVTIDVSGCVKENMSQAARGQFFKRLSSYCKTNSNVEYVHENQIGTKFKREGKMCISGATGRYNPSIRCVWVNGYAEL